VKAPPGHAYVVYCGRRGLRVVLAWEEADGWWIQPLGEARQKLPDGTPRFDDAEEAADEMARLSEN